jgi:hypothetical protein
MRTFSCRSTFFYALNTGLLTCSTLFLCESLPKNIEKVHRTGLLCTANSWCGWFVCKDLRLNIEEIGVLACHAAM